MPLNQIGPTPFGVALDGVPRRVVARGGTVYYGPDQTVSPSNNTGSLADGVALDFFAPTYIYGPGLDVEVDEVRTSTEAREYGGTVTLAAGAATVNTDVVQATTRVLLTSQVDGGTPGWLRVSARTAGTSFTITSSSNTDTSTVAWQAFEAA